MFAVLGTWMEADVVEATVKNAFMQGCERVFLVDNDSQDDTVPIALSAGAELARSYSTPEFHETVRNRLMNETVAEQSAADGSSNIWWLWLDADEFPHGPRGLTIREYLAALDSAFRIVGARYFNHYPADEPAYVSGAHPLDFQPLAEELLERRCWLWHRKHPLQRFDRGGPAIEVGTGFHRAESGEHPLLEPSESIFVHHFPYRRRDVTLRRFESLLPAATEAARADPERSPAMAVRRRSLDAVYARDWARVEMQLQPDLRRPRVEPLPWTELVDAEHHHVDRWYSEQLSPATPHPASQAV